MKLEFSARSLADLRRIGAQSRNSFGGRVAAALERRIRSAIEQIRQSPGSARESNSGRECAFSRSSGIRTESSIEYRKIQSGFCNTSYIAPPMAAQLSR